MPDGTNTIQIYGHGRVKLRNVHHAILEKLIKFSPEPASQMA